MPKFLRWLLVGSLLLSVSAEATDPDFVMNFVECKGVVAPLYLTKNIAIKIHDGIPFVMWCVRHGEIMDCQTDFKDGGTGIKGTNISKYKIVIDSPPLLMLKLTNGTEDIIINTSQNAAVISSLLVDINFAGSKVCHGSYFTNFQLKNLK